MASTPLVVFAIIAILIGLLLTAVQTIVGPPAPVDADVTRRVGVNAARIN